jgi:hypothetical protein
VRFAAQFLIFNEMAEGAMGFLKGRKKQKEGRKPEPSSKAQHSRGEWLNLEEHKGD